MAHKELLVRGWQARVAEPGFQGLQQWLQGAGEQLEEDGCLLVACRSHASFSCKLMPNPRHTAKQAGSMSRTQHKNQTWGRSHLHAAPWSWRFSCRLCKFWQAMPKPTSFLLLDKTVELPHLEALPGGSHAAAGDGGRSGGRRRFHRVSQPPEPPPLPEARCLTAAAGSLDPVADTRCESRMIMQKDITCFWYNIIFFKSCSQTELSS